MTQYFQLTPNPYPLGPEAGDGEPALLSYTPDRLPTRFPRLWIDGERFAVPPPLPVQVSIEPEEAGRLLDYYDTPLGLMAPTIRSLFADAGIDNLDLYPVELVDETSGSTRTDYVAFNIVGLVAAADMARSRHENFDGLVMFDKIELRARSIGGLKMFRMAESPSTIVVHESLKLLAESRGITSLQFHPLEVSP